MRAWGLVPWIPALNEFQKLLDNPPWQTPAPAEWTGEGTGWHMYHDCGTRPLTSIHFTLNATGDSHTWNCAPLQAGAGYPMSQGVDTAIMDIHTQGLSNGRRTMIFGEKTSATRHTNKMWWHRYAGSSHMPAPWERAPRPGVELVPDPGSLPSYAPETIPIGRPSGVPSPIPYRALPYRIQNPWRSPSEQTEQGPAPSARRGSAPARATRFRIGQRPGQRANVSSGGPRPERKPPEKGVKERKVRIAGSKGLNAALAGLNAFTEGLDMIGAFYDALPDHLRPKRPTTMAERIAIVFRNFDDINVAEALAGVLANVGGDATAAYFGKRSGGLQRGPWDELLSDELKDKKARDWKAEGERRRREREIARRDRERRRAFARYARESRRRVGA